MSWIDRCLQCPISRLCTDCAALNELNQQLVEAKALWQALERRISDCKSGFNARADRVTGRLPIEIASHIFELYVETSQVYEYPEGETHEIYTVPRDVPLRLGAVCRRWREIAWSLPTLWTTLAIDLFCKGLAHGPHLVLEWLERTAGRALTIQFRPNDATLYTSANEEASKIIELINRFAAQWKVLDLTGLPYFLLLAVNDSQYTNADTPSLLTHIRVDGRVTDPGMQHIWRSVLPKSRRKHRPTHISWLSPYLPISLNVEWAHVTHIHIANSGLDGVLKTIQAIALKATLTHLSVHNLTRIETSQPIPLLVELPTVHQFSIGGPNAQDTCELLLDRITLPSLQTLCVNNGSIPIFSFRRPPINTLKLFISRSVFPLVELDIGNFSMESTSLIDMLWSIPSLVKLTLKTVSHLDEFFPALSNSQANPLSRNGHIFLPFLSFLNLAVYPCIDIWRLLLDIWDSRDFSDTCTEDADWPGHKPFRRDLQVSLSVASPNAVPQADELMDRFSLKRLIFLWTRYRMLPCSIELVWVFHPDRREKSGAGTKSDFAFLEQSYMHHFSGDWKDDALYQCLKDTGFFSV